MPAISVILSNYNGETYLAEAVRSVWRQTNTDWELLVIDDASSDRSIPILEALQAENPAGIRILRHEKNLGQAEGFNTGIQAASAPVLSFLDSDDLWLTDKLSIVARHFQDHPDCAVFQHQLYIMEDSTPGTRTVKQSLFSGSFRDHIANSKKLGVFTPTSGLSFSMASLKKMGPIPAAFRTCADGYMTRTAGCHGPIHADAMALGYYRNHTGNNTYNNADWNNKKYVHETLLPHLVQYYHRTSIPHKLDKFRRFYLVSPLLYRVMKLHAHTLRLVWNKGIKRAGKKAYHLCRALLFGKHPHPLTML